MSDQHGALLGNLPPLLPANAQHISSAQSTSSASSTYTAVTAGTSNGFPTGEILHVSHLSEDIGSLYLNDDYSDVVLLIGGQRFKAHRVILACRSEYFRALLFGGLRESAMLEIEVHESNVAAFRILLNYIYTGRLSLSSMQEEMILIVLGLAHKYGFVDLETSISEYLRAILNAHNLCVIFGASHLYTLPSLANFCLEFADLHASEVLQSASFLQLEASAVQQLISRDSFCAPEVDIFRALCAWARENPSTTQACFEHVRFHLMRMEDLLNVVRPTGLISPDVMLDAITEKTEKRDMDLRYRGYMMADSNVATPAHGAQVIDGELRQALLNGESVNYDMERGFTRHPIEPQSEGIVVQLGMQCIINHIKLLLWDKDTRSYSYIVEVSMDKNDWVRVADYSAFLCRSWQYIFFPARVVKYIRVLGKHNTVNRVFHLVHLEALYSSSKFELDSCGILCPTENVASDSLGACVLEGVSRTRNALLNGDVEGYDWDTGYTCHQLNSGSIVVQLAQPYVIDSMRLLLWDCDDRSYSYYIEISTDQQHWIRVTDRTSEPCSSWQLIRFAAQRVSFVKIVGTQNTANEVFHCVHFECPAQSDCVSTMSAGMRMNQANRAAHNTQQQQGGQPQGMNGHSVASGSSQGQGLQQQQQQMPEAQNARTPRAESEPAGGSGSSA